MAVLGLEAHVAVAQGLVEAQRTLCLTERLEGARVQELHLFGAELRMVLVEAREDLFRRPRLAVVEAGARAGKEDSRVVREGTLEAALVEADRLVEHAALEALVGELHAVFHARARGGFLGAALELSVGVQCLGDVARVLAHRAVLARLREHFHEVVGEASDHREDDDDRDPHPAATGLDGVEGERELDDREEDVEESHGWRFSGCRGRPAVNQFTRMGRGFRLKRRIGCGR
jgi:hypothetical protein